jgi:heme-degrading monooxygenase HmoA
VSIESAVVVVNVFTPKPGKLGEFIESQGGFLRRMAGSIPGLRGGRLYRAADGSRALLFSVFESEAKLSQWMTSAEFAGHRERIAPLLEKSEPGRFELVYEAGSV